MKHVFRFRVTLDEIENVKRKIEILPSQTFEDLHNMITSCFDLKRARAASFFTSDENWKKKKEIVVKQDADEDMIDGAETKLKDLVHLESRHFVYFIDAFPQFTFMVELVSGDVEIDPDAKYPRCVTRVGEIPGRLATFGDIFDENLGMNDDDLFGLSEGKFETDEL